MRRSRGCLVEGVGVVFDGIPWYSSFDDHFFEQAAAAFFGHLFFEVCLLLVSLFAPLKGTNF